MFQRLTSAGVAPVDHFTSAVLGIEASNRGSSSKGLGDCIADGCIEDGFDDVVWFFVLGQPSGNPTKYSSNTIR
jgi:hypothetical protein